VGKNKKGGGWIALILFLANFTCFTVIVAVSAFILIWRKKSTCILNLTVALKVLISHG